MRTLLTAVAGVLLLGAQAQAHTIAWGYNDLGGGNVDFWIATYHTNSETPQLEGSLSVSGGPSGNGSFAFTNAGTGATPAGLVLGTNYFVANTWTASNIGDWQGVSLTGLSNGTYTVDITGMNSAKWSRLTGSSGLPWPLQFRVTNAVPEPTSLALLGAGVLGLGLMGVRRRRKQRAA